METNVKENQIKGKNNKKTIIISIVAVLLCLGFILTGVYIFLSSPKVKVLKSISKLSKEIESQKDFLEYVTSEEDYEKNLLNGTDSSINIGFSDNSVQCNFNSKMDNINKKADITFAGILEGEELNANLFTDNHNVMFRLPNIYDSWFSFNCENIMSQYENSILGSQTQVDNDVSLKVFNENVQKTVTNKEAIKVIKEKYIDNNKNELNKIFDDVKIEELKEKKVITLKDKTRNCTGYTLSLDKEKIGQVFDNFCEYVEGDNEGRKALESYIVSMASVINSKDNNSVSISSDLTLEKSIDIIKRFISIDGIDVTLYIDQKGNIQSLSLNVNVNETISNEIKRLSMNLDLEFNGEEKITDNINSKIRITDKSNFESVIFDLNIINKEENNSVTKKIKGTVSASGNTANIDINNTYNIEDKTIVGNVKADKMNLNYEGTFDYDTSLKELKFDFSKIELSEKSLVQDANLNLTASYSIKPLANDIEEPTESKKEIFKMSQEDYQKIYLDIMQNQEVLQHFQKIYSFISK